MTSPDLQTPITYIDLNPVEESMAESVIAGLRASPKYLESKFLYDERGSRLFERICEQPEYYPTRTELGILRAHAADIAALVGPEAHVIELGAGALEKVGLLLAALKRPAGFTAIDISGDHLKEAAEALASEFPDIEISAVCADYTAEYTLPDSLGRGARRRVGFFPGSTIGNFTPEAAERFLLRQKTVFGLGGLMIVGVDLRKDKAILDAAYNDAAGVTAAFNLNMLAHINAELGADFDLDRFAHRAAYIPERGRVELHLESLADQAVHVAGETFHLSKGERIHTENSCKYDIAAFQDLARRAGWTPRAVHTDAESLFSLHVLEV